MIQTREGLHLEKKIIRKIKERDLDRGKSPVRVDAKTVYLIDLNKHNPVERVANNLSNLEKFRNLNITRHE